MNLYCTLALLISRAVPAVSAADVPAEATLSSALYEPYACMAGPNGEMIKTVAQKISATLSLLGSIYIVAFVRGKWRRDSRSLDPYQRIMAAYSVYDMLFSFFCFFLGSWMTPDETGWWGAAGNTATCSMQGFFYVFAGTGSVLYQIMLSLQMLLLVAYDWRPSEFEERIEYRMHGCIGVFTVILASVPLFFQGYNPRCGVCGAVPLPLSCADPSDSIQCLRGSATITSVYLPIFVLLVFAATVFCTGAMVAIYRSVNKAEQKMDRFSFGNVADREMSKSIRTRMLLYTSSFYVCWLVPLALVYVIPNTPYALTLVGAALPPLMGCFNVLTFILPRCQKYQKGHAGTWLLVAYFHVVFEMPIATLRHWTTFTNSATGETDALGSAEDGIGLGAYNARAEPPDGARATAGGETAPPVG